MKERTGAGIFVVAYPIAVALGLAVHPAALPIDAFLAAPLLWPLAVFFRRFKATTSGLEIETADVKDDLTTAVAAIEEKTTPKGLTALPEAEKRGQATLGAGATITGAPVLQLGELTSTIGIITYVTAEDTANPRSDVVDFLLSEDPAVQLAALRIAIERELRGAAELAHLPGAPGSRTLPLKRLMTELVRRELLPDDLAVPLTRVIEVANRAIHGAPIESGADDVVADLAPRLIDGLRQLPTTSRWRAALVRIRAGERPVQTMPRQDLPLGDSAGLIVGDVPIVLARTLWSFDRLRRDAIRFAEAPPGPHERHVTHDMPIAWISGRRIVGTPTAKTLAPWLIDDVVDIWPAPEPSAPSRQHP